ncbi:MAG: D-2-hydroxyacid dehydrogenase [Clostridia bacterium]|nr:D-2-hydroxyacid dehydrogenase [Clostridia bacterium]
MKIVVTIPVVKKHIELLEAACPGEEFVFDRKPGDDLLGEAEIIVGGVPTDKLCLCKKLKFLQLSMAGSDAYAGIMPEGVLLANASGAYGLAISEHMLGNALMLMKKLHLYRDNQLESEWKDEGRVTSFEGARVLCVGLGDIGGEFAKRCKALGSYCIGIRRTIHDRPDYIDELHTLNDLDLILPTADIVALSLPQSEQSKKLFNEARLRAMKHGAILLNVGRGSAIDTDALVKVLNEGHILAGVDVTDPEPLPKDHPLWKCRNALITPHISGYYHLQQTHDRIVKIAAENIHAFVNGGTVMNVVDGKTGYRKTENRY